MSREDTVAKSYERAPWTHIVGRNTQTSLKFQENKMSGLDSLVGGGARASLEYISCC